jgi:branched-chain amino acid transport system permease protein
MRALRDWTPKTATERTIAAVALVIVACGPVIFNEYWVGTLLTQTFIYGIVAASLIFLTAYGGMISLAQTALMGIAGYVVGNMVTERIPGGETKGFTLGWDPNLAVFLAIGITTLLGLLMGIVAARSAGIYFLMLTLTYAVIANAFFGQVIQFGGFSPIAGINRDQYMPAFVGDILGHPDKLYYICLGVALGVYVLIRYVVRTPFGLSLQGLRDDPVRMSSLGYNVPLHRTMAFTLAAFFASLAGVLLVWWQGQIAPGDLGLGSTINVLVMAVIGGLVRVEGAWIGALAYLVIENYARNIEIPGLGFGGTLFGGSFNTIIGIIFLVIVLVSPDGLMGFWDRITRGGIRRRPDGGIPVPQPEPEPGSVA